MIRSNTTRTRPGFTLVELMISAAITVLIMTILSICFQTSMKAMSSMRAQGDAADQLRAIGEVMKRDFKADHHLSAEGSFQVRNNGRRISDYDYRFGATANTGFVQITSPASTFEGNDGSFDSFRNTGSSIWFTSVLPGGNEGNLYTASVAGNVLSSEAAEVAYFLVANGQFTSGAPSLPLCNLHRRQRLLAMDSAKAGSFPTSDPEVISVNQPGAPPTWTVNTMSAVANGFRPSTSGATSIYLPLGGARLGDDIILSNVLSLEIKPTWEKTGATPGPRPFGNSTVAINSFDTFNATTNNLSSDAPHDTLSAFPGSLFDSLNPTSRSIRVNAVMVRIRVYDPKVKTARQSSYIYEQ